MIVNSGTATLDFGSAPGNCIATYTVPGQIGITASAQAEAWLMGSATVQHNADEYAVVASISGLTCGSIVDGASFKITCVTQFPITGTLQVQWVWST